MQRLEGRKGTVGKEPCCCQVHIKERTPIVNPRPRPTLGVTGPKGERSAVEEIRSFSSGIYDGHWVEGVGGSWGVGRG